MFQQVSLFKNLLVSLFAWGGGEEKLMTVDFHFFLHPGAVSVILEAAALTGDEWKGGEGVLMGAQTRCLRSITPASSHQGQQSGSSCLVGLRSGGHGMQSPIRPLRLRLPPSPRCFSRLCLFFMSNH